MSAGNTQRQNNFTSCLSHRSKSNKQKLVMQQVNSVTVGSPAKLNIGKVKVAA